MKDIEERVKMNAVPALEHRLKGVEDAFTGEVTDKAEINEGWWLGGGGYLSAQSFRNMKS